MDNKVVLYGSWSGANAMLGLQCVLYQDKPKTCALRLTLRGLGTVAVNIHICVVQWINEKYFSVTDNF